MIRGGDMTAVDLCRVSVQTSQKGVLAAVDLSLPTRLELGEIIPGIVELAGAHDSADSDLRKRWTLSRLGGSALDESMTLRENGVHDGDILLLTSAAPDHEPNVGDLCSYIVEASSSAARDSDWPKRIGAVACLWSVTFGATALIWSGLSAPSSRATVAAIMTVAAIAAAIVVSRIDGESLPTSTLGVSAAVFGAVTGFLVVPGGPAPPNFFLAAAICSAISTVLLRVTSRGTTVFVAVAAFSTVAAVIAAVAAVWPFPRATQGAVLATASLAMVVVAAKLSILLTGLSPSMPNAVDSTTDEDIPAAIGAARALRGHQMLTGLMAGFALSAASGVVLVAAGLRSDDPLGGAAFAGVVSAVLLFRASQQQGAIRSMAVGVAGLVSTTATFTLITLSAPQHAPWVCPIAVALGAGTLGLTQSGLGTRVSPFVRRVLEFVDYLSLAAVVPLACWVAGVFGFVRGLSLA